MVIYKIKEDYVDALYNRYILTCARTKDFTLFREAELDEGIQEVWNFIKELAQNCAFKIKDIVQAFKNSQIFTFFASFKFSFKNIADAFKMVYKIAKDISGFIPRKTAGLLLTLKGKLPADIQEKLKTGVIKVDRFLKSKGKIGNIIFACFMIWVYLEAGLSGDVSYDFDAGDVIDAARGRLTFAEFFLGDKGDFTNKDGSTSLAFEYLALIILGKIGYGGILPYAQFSNGAFLAISLLQYFAKEVGIRISKGRNADADMDKAQAAFT